MINKTQESNGAKHENVDTGKQDVNWNAIQLGSVKCDEECSSLKQDIEPRTEGS